MLQLTATVQGPPAGPPYPTLHVHALLPAGDVLYAGHVEQLHMAVVEYLPAKQFSQATFPESLLYLPAWHAWQTNGSVPTISYPNMHMHAVTEVLSEVVVVIPGQV